MDTVSEIKAKADIVEFIGQYTKLVRSGKTLKGLCPFHSEKHGSFFVYPENQSWHCFGACSTGGDIFSFIMKKEGLSFTEAIDRLAEKYGIQISSKKMTSPERERYDRIYQANAAAAQYFHNLLLNSPEAAKARAYLQERGVNENSIANFQLGYALPEWQALRENLNEAGFDDSILLEAGLLGSSDSGRCYDRFRDQLIIPIAEIRGRISGFGARVLNDSQPKYLNSPETLVFSKSSTLFGIGLAAPAIRQQDMAIITEGYFDTVISHQYGFNNTIASMGTAITEKQIAILKKLTKHIVLAMDADEAGEEAVSRCISFENLLDSEIKVITSPPEQDPDDVIRRDHQEWGKMIGSAVPLMDFILMKTSAKYDLNTAQGKADLANSLLPVIAEIQDPVRRGHYITEAAKKVGISPTEMQYKINKLKNISRPPKARDAVTTPEKSIVETGAVNSVESYVLTILLKNPELKAQAGLLRPEYFEDTENRLIFEALLANSEITSVRDELDSILHDRLDYLLTQKCPDNRLNDRITECVMRLEEKYLKNTASKIKDVLNAEENHGSSAEILKYHEQGLKLDSRLADLFKRKEDRGRSPER